jgi:hypothetical protein
LRKPDGRRRGARRAELCLHVRLRGEVIEQGLAELREWRKQFLTIGRLAAVDRFD